MITAKEVKKYTGFVKITTLSLEHLIMAAQINHLNYIFIDKDLVNPELQNELRNLGYGVVVGYGDVARIKISW